MKPNKKEIENIIKLDAFKRYQHFIKRVADTQIMYTLQNGNGDYCISQLNEYISISFWPFGEYAELCKSGEWENYSVVSIDFDKFENQIAPIIIKENYLLSIFPANEKTGFVVNLEEFRRDLNEELENY